MTHPASGLLTLLSPGHDRSGTSRSGLIEDRTGSGGPAPPRAKAGAPRPSGTRGRPRSLEHESGSGDLCPRVSVLNRLHGIPFGWSRVVRTAARRPAPGPDTPLLGECSPRYGG